MAEKFAGKEKEKDDVQKVAEIIGKMLKIGNIALDIPKIGLSVKEERYRFVQELPKNYVEIRKSEPNLGKEEALRRAITATIQKGEFVLIDNVSVKLLDISYTDPFGAVTLKRHTLADFVKQLP